MLSYTDLGMALMVIAALIAAIALINRHSAPPSQPTGRMTLAHRDHVRMLDDPGQSLGRRRDDGAGGES